MTSQPAATAQAGGVIARKGASERWGFTANGKEMGSQTAQCVAVRPGQSDWKFALDLRVPSQGAAVAVTMSGTFTIAANGTPIALALEADAAGSKQRAAYTFAGKKATARITVGGQSITRDAALGGSETLQLNNLITLMSFTTQTVRPQAGKVVTASIFAASALQTMKLTLTAQPKTETITVAGKRVECVVVDAAPIANKFWCDARTGELLKVAAPAQALVIERR
jgi:hypothetical protein